MMGRAQSVSQAMRFLPLVEESLQRRGILRNRETAGECVEVPDIACGYRGDCAGIHSAAEIRSQRHIAHELPIDCRFETVAESFCPLFQSLAALGLVCQIPIHSLPDRSVLDQQIMA